MARGAVHTVPKDGDWTNELEGHSAESASYPTKEEAVLAGRAVAKGLNVEHMIHDRDGHVRARHNYGRQTPDVAG